MQLNTQGVLLAPNIQQLLFVRGCIQLEHSLFTVYSQMLTGTVTANRQC